jgi:hypothetical protein
MPQRKSNRRKRRKAGANMVYTGPLKLYNAVRPRIFTVEATCATYAATTGAGAINFTFTLGQFGFAGATYPLTCQFTSNGSYQVRAVGATVYYDPLFGPSTANGSGAGVAAVVHESTITPSIVNVLGILGWKSIRHGAPFKLQWRASNINESLWYSGSTSSLATSPSPGFNMVAATTGGAASITIGEIYFSFILQVREQ